jgi:hypothetical protein
MKACHDFVRKLEKKVTYFCEHLYSQKACWVVIGAGIVFRISQYLYNRSLTEGEAALALNIIQRTYSGLLKPLDYVQAAPFGFLMLQKFATSIFGTHEYALRIFPLIAGIISLFLFYEIAKKAINEKALPIALILFAVGDHLIYFSSEVKQYSSDVAITLLILLLTINIIKNKYTFRNIFVFGCVGAISFWFSHPALFTFCGGTVVLFFSIMQTKKRHILFWLFIAIVLAAISFVINYFVSLESVIGSKDFMSSWHGRFESFPQIPFDPQWLGYVFLRTFKFPVGLSTYELFLAALSFLIGCAVLLCKRMRILLALLLPILFTIIAAEFRKYPFEGRLLLFITPFVVLIIAVGIHYIQSKASCGSPIVGFTLVLLLLIQPVFLAGYRLIVPRAPEELRTVMEYTQKHYREGDMIYLYYASSNAYQFYADRFDFTEDYIVGIDARSEWARYDQDLRQLVDKERVWVMFSHVATWYGVDEEKLFLSYLDRYGIRKDTYRASGASVYLYDMSN